MSSRDSELLHVITKILIQTIKKEIRSINTPIINSTEYENKSKKSMESLYERLKPIKRKVT